MAFHLHLELEKIKGRILDLGTQVETSMDLSIKSVLTRDRDLGQHVIENDDEIDRCEIEIEEDCLKLLALHQPVAKDLRYLIAILKINSDLERIGDLAVNIAERGLYLLQHEKIPEPFQVEDMSKRARSMLRRSLNSLVIRDSQLASEVIEEDEIIDAMNRDMYQRVFSEIKKDPDLVEPLIQYLSISRHLERIGDYATNISEDVIYLVEGKIVRHIPEIFGQANEDFLIAQEPPSQKPSG